jgi:hypothetical protein
VKDLRNDRAAAETRPFGWQENVETIGAALSGYSHHQLDIQPLALGRWPGGPYTLPMIAWR